jgi:hypothetical protein
MPGEPLVDLDVGLKTFSPMAQHFFSSQCIATAKAFLLTNTTTTVNALVDLRNRRDSKEYPIRAARKRITTWLRGLRERRSCILGDSSVELDAEQLINVVRREEQAELLPNIGARHVVATGSGESWREELASKSEELDATVAFDAVASRSAGDLLDVLPPKGSVYVYSGLTGRVENVDPMALIYHEQKLKGYFLNERWIRQGGTLRMLPRITTASRKVNGGLKRGGWSSSQFKDTTLENAQADFVKLRDSGITGHKLRIRLDLSTEMPYRTNGYESFFGLMSPQK